MKTYGIRNTSNGHLVCLTWDEASWERTFLELTLISGPHFEKFVHEYKIIES